VANSIIQNNEGRRGKTLWSEIDDGRRPIVYRAKNEIDEATRIAQDIRQTVTQMDAAYRDIAVLYRVHTLSRALEEKLRVYAIPYRVYGGVSFYDRKEVKDIVAYLHLIVNPAADTQLLRVINTPKRGIGDAKVQMLRDIAESSGIPILEAIKNADVLAADQALKKKAAEFYAVYEAIGADIENMTVPEIIERVYTATGYKQALEDEGTPEAAMRMENVEELINSAYPREDEAEESLETFLQNITLITDLDSMDEEGGVTLMTMHAAKGLEFDVVYIAGMDENIFPSKRALDEGNLEEERRLCYVAVTRARKKLYMLHTQTRSLYGRIQPSAPSRFLGEVEDGLIEDLTPVKQMTAGMAEEKKMRTFFSGGMKQEKIVPKKVSGRLGVGTVVAHKLFGRGTIMSVMGEGDSRVAVVDFENAGQKKMFLALAALDVID
jgi:DNA helicase-2/ATP-dependent DNA helicase PcrA